jgi:hypothetical protein
MAILALPASHGDPQMWPAHGMPPERTYCKCQPVRSAPCPKSITLDRLGMGKDILVGPAGEIKPNPFGKEPEAGGGEFLASLAGQHGVELGL